MALSDFKIRREACRLAALALRATDAAESYAPRIWSLAVFFEMYLRDGAEGTRKDFGPPKPVKLSANKPRASPRGWKG